MDEGARVAGALSDDDRAATVKDELLTDLVPYPETLRELGFEERLQSTAGTLRVWSMKVYTLRAAVDAEAFGWSRHTVCAVAILVDSTEPVPAGRLSFSLQAVGAEGCFAGSLTRDLSPPPDTADNSFLRELDATMKVVEQAQVRPANMHGLCCTILNAAQEYKPVADVLHYSLIRHFLR